MSLVPSTRRTPSPCHSVRQAASRFARRHAWTLALAALVGCEAESPSTPMAAKPPTSEPASAASAEQPATEKPATEKPATEQPAADSPAANPASDTKVDGEKADGEKAGGEKLAIDNVSFTVPAGWVAKPIPPGGFIDAEFVLPKADGDDADGRLTLSRAGGAIEANIDRWRGQFGGKPEKDEVKTLDVAGLKVTWVDLSGEFNDSRGPMAPAKIKAGYRMLAAIIPAGDFSVFVKATGPQKTLEAQAEKLKTFVQSAKVE